jgi:excisionase family DNA binding protein
VERALLSELAPATSQPSRGRPRGSRSSYFVKLEEQTRRMAGLKDQLLGDPCLRIAEVQIALGLGYGAVRRLITSGQLKATRTTAQNGHYRVKCSALQAYLSELKQ